MQLTLFVTIKFLITIKINTRTSFEVNLNLNLNCLPVSCIVEDHDQNSGRFVLGQSEDGGQCLRCRRRREDRSGDGRVQHARPDVAGERGLVARSPAANNGHTARQNIGKI